MIGSITGTVLERTTTTCTINLGGLGIQVECTPTTISHFVPGETATLWTSLVVREDSLTLFGFVTAQERDTFNVLQSVTGVGPRLAQSVLTTLSPAELRAAVSSADTATLTQISGVGKKSAQRMILDLADRLGPRAGIETVDVREGDAPTGAWRAQVEQALIGLGWSERDASSAVAAVAADVSEHGEGDISEMLRRALHVMDSR